jgi:hypothetical protein
MKRQQDIIVSFVVSEASPRYQATALPFPEEFELCVAAHFPPRDVLSKPYDMLSTVVTSQLSAAKKVCKQALGRTVHQRYARPFIT